MKAIKFIFWVIFFISSPSYSQEANDISTNNGTSKILILGDSLSAGYGLLSGESWVDLLQNSFATKNTWHIENASISGETSDGGKRRIPDLLQKYQPQIVILELGANDGLRGFAPNITYKNLEFMIQQSQLSGAKVLLVGIHLPPNYGEIYEKDFYKNYVDLSQKYHTPLVPFLLEKVGDNPELMQQDGLHPKAKAQPLILENVLLYLKPLLKIK
ncbi:MAG: arylesterase [Gammaproteobacteria bacterium CG22_combo_CG10-13_8_21_14_all_40_8]|nr:MAG: arylesterase [Gammaproteobacteria bacterium CG22_combo_CG10-13_8_21_14_all_40_8]